MKGMKAFWPPSVRGEGTNEVTLEEFKQFLEKFDRNKDGKICAKELTEAIRARGGWFSQWKAKRGVKLADENFNGVIDENEISNLVAFAEKHLGMVVV